jgi:hypothetical protein
VHHSHLTVFPSENQVNQQGQFVSDYSLKTSPFPQDALQKTLASGMPRFPEDSEKDVEGLLREVQGGILLMRDP